MSYHPLHDKIVVKLVNETEVRASGLHIPVANTSNTTAKQGEVIAVGPGRITANGELVPTTVKVGDVVFFNSYESTELPASGNDKISVVSEQSVYVIKG